MPRGDGTGPNGQGPMTGRCLGYCAGFNSPGFTRPGFGRRFQRGMGFGRRAMQQMPIQTQPQVITQEQEKQFLEQDKEAVKQEIDSLKQELKQIEGRIKEIK